MSGSRQQSGAEQPVSYDPRQVSQPGGLWGLKHINTPWVWTLLIISLCRLRRQCNLKTLPQEYAHHLSTFILSAAAECAYCSNV